MCARAGALGDELFMTSVEGKSGVESTGDSSKGGNDGGNGRAADPSSNGVGDTGR